MTSQEPATPDEMVDGAIGVDDGGREAGDIELAIFRRIRSLSNVSGKRLIANSGGNGYRRYLADPLSMFSQGAEDTQPPESPSVGSSKSDDEDDEADTLEEDADSGLEHYVSHGVAWRDAMVQACADLLGKNLEELEREFTSSKAATDASNTAFSCETKSFEPMPRDVADYAIMSTLKVQDALSMQNATSWLFNMMDRTGAGYVLREEFIRYAPFIGPVADAAVAGIVFDELVQEQVRRAAENNDDEVLTDRKGKQTKVESERNSPGETREGLRRRKQSAPRKNAEVGSHAPREDDNENGSLANDSNVSVMTQPGDPSARELYPPAMALRYETWRPFFVAIQDKYRCHDDDWVNVKQQLGIDSGEHLIKSQPAVDHSDLFPTLGKLYLSERYLIFHAAVGRNHYVARLGAIAEVNNSAIPLMMRDCLKITLESEVKVAMDGISALPKEDSSDSKGNAQNGQQKKEPDAKREPTLSEHVGTLMRKFSSGRKPLMFSLMEFRETKRRDNWVKIVREIVAAHKLHVQLGFGSSGRAVPSVQSLQVPSSDEVSHGEGETDSKENKKAQEMNKGRMLNYIRSPFRNEPSPPLLVVAAHGNIVRYRALRRVTRKRVTNSLLLFSHPDRNAQLINWYTDSVRAYDNRRGRSWIERALTAIRDNMDINDRMYRLQDDEPFDPAILGDAIGRFAELCSPVARTMQFLSHLFQWRNPPATILAILVCIGIAAKGLVNYVPAFLLFCQAAWVVETRYNWLGLGMGQAGSEDAETRQANVLALVAQVHDTLAAAQNVLSKLNRELGKVQSLCLWGTEEWQSWVAVGFLMFVSLILLIVPTRTLFLGTVFFLFFKHFLPPSNPALRFWQGIPSRVVKQTKLSRKAEARRRRRGSTPRASQHLSNQG